jgi:hypothetical protein
MKKVCGKVYIGQTGYSIEMRVSELHCNLPPPKKNMDRSQTSQSFGEKESEVPVKWQISYFLLNHTPLPRTPTRAIISQFSDSNFHCVRKRGSENAPPSLFHFPCVMNLCTIKRTIFDPSLY